ncbi:MAG: hypothetical protein WED07_01300 [Candidatus Freyarchaeum deiterrae]
MASGKISQKGKKLENETDEKNNKIILDELRNDISKLKTDLAEIKTMLVRFIEESPVILQVEEVKDVSFEEAKPMVENFLKEYLKEHETVYPSDVAESLGLDYELVRNVIDTLIKEDKLEKEEGGD